MKWRLEILLLASLKIIRRRPFASVQNVSLWAKSQIDHTDKSFGLECNTSQPRISVAMLNPRIVQSTLLNCSSDLVALSFFIWCTRQPNYFHGQGVFNSMVDVVTRLTQRFLTVKGIIDQLERVGCPKRPQTLLLLLRIYWSGGKHSMVIECFEEMVRYGYTPNTFARNIIIDVLFKIGRGDVALSLLNDTRLPNFLSFSIAICNLCKLNDFVNIQRLLRTMLKMGYSLNGQTFLKVLHCYCKMGHLKVALQLLGLMIPLGIPISVNVWGLLIDGFCRCGSIDMAGNLLKRMIESGYSPNVIVCTPLVKALMKSNRLCEAIDIINTMESRACYPDLVLCNVLIDCLSKMGRYADAIDVFHSLPRRKLLPDAYTVCSIISTICLSGQFVLLPVLISGLAIEADLAICNSLLNYFCKAGYPSGAVGFYNDMIDRGFIPNKYTYVGLLSGLCELRRVREAVNVYNGIIRSFSGLDAYIHTVIVNGLIKFGYFHEAIKLFRKAAKEGYPMDVVSYTVAINGLFRHGQTSEAYALFSQMKMVGIAPNIRTYNAMLSGFCGEKDVTMVQQILGDMIIEGIEMNIRTFKLLRNFLYQTRFSQAVLNLLIELLGLNLMPKDTMLAIFADGLASGVDFSDTQLSLLKGILFDIHKNNTLGSNDFPRVVASMG